MRDFKNAGSKYTIAYSNNCNYKWQAMRFDTKYNAWVRTSFYGNTLEEVKENVNNNKFIRK